MRRACTRGKQGKRRQRMPSPLAVRAERAGRVREPCSFDPAESRHAEQQAWPAWYARGGMGPTDWQIPLAVAAGLFLTYMVWRSRPVFTRAQDASEKATLKAAQDRIEAAGTETERAIALC